MGEIMYIETTVKKPRNVYQCTYCCNPIEGEHVKIVQVQDGDFHSDRAHKECQEACKDMCAGCEYQYDCQSSVTECFLNTYVFN